MPAAGEYRQEARGLGVPLCTIVPARVAASTLDRSCRHAMHLHCGTPHEMVSARNAMVRSADVPSTAHRLLELLIDQPRSDRQLLVFSTPWRASIASTCCAAPSFRRKPRSRSCKQSRLSGSTCPSSTHYWCDSFHSSRTPTPVPRDVVAVSSWISTRRSP